MPEARIPDRALTLLFCLLSCLLSSLELVIANQVKANCDSIILFIVFLAMIPLLCLCGLMKRFCRKCRQPEQTPPEAQATAPLEIWVPTLDPPPPYDQVIMKPIEPPPPYSLMPEDPVGPMCDTDNTAF
ncbi:transmembrane protein 92-like [Cricetulus griseus]|uniref:Transmembrane protein 92-like n=1 Tax=Cricetulus griseus TaxID=10029 RepID=A0A9J7JVJ7_CRIGR|nr:transmembrane protein 92-like [Cricetulus griseus]